MDNQEEEAQMEPAETISRSERHSRSKNHNRKGDRSKSRIHISPLPEKMDEEDSERCLNITNKLADSIYAFCYKTPPSPDDEEQLQYDKSCSKPMYFETVISNLENGIYCTVQSWKNDVNLIFDNALDYYPPKTMRYEAAFELKNKFLDLLSVFDKSEEELWISKIDYLCYEYANAENEE